VTLTFDQLRGRYSPLFSNIEKVEESIARLTRFEGATPFAFYYVDFSSALPNRPEELTVYLDRVIGSRYFEGPNSLQWNTYLYFVISKVQLQNEDAQRRAEFIERDRTYARKYVVSEEGLDAALVPPVVKPSVGNISSDVLSTWTALLSEVGIEKAIFTSVPFPQRLALIEASSPSQPKPSHAETKAQTVVAEPFIRRLKLTKFRRFPTRRGFDFGLVNLICGVNGSGKTSLLEAIELLYCGKNKRTPRTTSDYQLDATFENGKEEKATQERDYAFFRSRNLNWYGQRDIKTSNLYMSFSQFNFLDTDAAVSLTDGGSAERIEEDLSKLLVGPDASKIWDDIQRVTVLVSTELRGAQQVEQEHGTKLAELDKGLAEVSGVRQESDSIRDRLAEMIKRLRWAPVAEGKEALAAEVVGALSELVPLAKKAVTLTWTVPPVSINGLGKFCRDATGISKRAEADISRLLHLRQENRLLADALKRGQEALELVTQVKRLIDAEIPERDARKKRIQTELSKYSNWLAGINPSHLQILSIVQTEMQLVDFARIVNAKQSEMATLLASAKTEYTKFSSLKNDSINLAQQLRQIAARIVESSQESDECPLCHTRFANGELAKHMNAGLDLHLEKAGQELLNELRDSEKKSEEAALLKGAIDSLQSFCKRAGLPADITVHVAMATVNGATRTLAETQDQLSAIISEENSLRTRGLSVEELRRISARLSELGHPIGQFSREAVEGLSNLIATSVDQSSRKHEVEQAGEVELERSLEKDLTFPDLNDHDFQNILAAVKERIATTETVRAKLADFSTRFPWPEDRPLSDLVVEGDSVRQVAGELQAAITRENQARISYEALVKQKLTDQEQLVALRKRINRLSVANSTLQSLQQNHSLTSATEEALQKNRKGIETIFLHIHSPAEFNGLAETFTTLSRAIDGSEATLSEISSGQRAAFALSIFLAQNAQLTVAPPVILMDDPISHVDDLNSLSFLDYLREIALMKQRQIFFATADEKLAALFERKFDFLGDKLFRRFELQRGLTSSDVQATQS
jgi:DNA repair protein SbcC/Rad50